MSQTKLEIGGIYQTDFDELPVKIISLDDYEVLYDCQWEEEKWMFSNNLLRKSSFYRIPTELFETSSSFIKNQDFSEQEFKAFRPDLLLRFGRFKEYSWNQIEKNNLKNLQKELSNKALNISNIFLIPYGPKGGYKKSVKIENDENLSIIEIISAAIKMQKLVNNENSNGIGIFREGIEKGIPSFYIGEYTDRANNVLN